MRRMGREYRIYRGVAGAERGRRGWHEDGKLLHGAEKFPNGGTKWVFQIS